MNGRIEHPAGDFRTRYRSLRSHWAELCERYLPVRSRNSIWRYSRGELPGDPAQGWKLHVAATVLTAGKVLQAVAPLLHDRRVLYKAPASLGELDKLNSGVVYGYSQVGKFITVYPQTTAESVLLARELRRLTRRMTAPAVPFDSKYGVDGCVYYRYGAFKAMEIEEPNGACINAIRDPAGNLVPDTRDSESKPPWLDDPFAAASRSVYTSRPASPLQTTFKAFRALAQRGRGGVYQALDMSVTPPRLCVVKQGRRHGEVSWDGRDGVWRVRHERRVLASLLEAGVAVPRVYSSFRAEKNYYLVVEFIEGESLGSWLTCRRRRLTVAAALRRAAEVARIVARVHAAGWVWRDCKPGNIIVTSDGELRPLDFEGACRIAEPDPLPWGTSGYAPPEVADSFRGQPRRPEDLYALGAITYLLLAGRPPEETCPVPLERMRRNVPAPVSRLVAELLDADPRRRPRARAAALRLEEALASVEAPTRSGGEVETAS